MKHLEQQLSNPDSQADKMKQGNTKTTPTAEHRVEGSSNFMGFIVNNVRRGGTDGGGKGRRLDLRYRK